MNQKNRSRYTEIDLTGLKRFSIDQLSRKVNLDEFAHPTEAGLTFNEFIQSLPKILRAQDLVDFAEIIASASQRNRAVIVMHGGHVVKTGLAPLLIDWMKRGVISAVATNGSSIIHDTEIALFGRTSEDVAEGLKDGSFGMVRETADFINGVISDPINRELGFGEALGKTLLEQNAPYEHLSLLCGSYQNSVPMTVHVAIGTDIIHQHPSADGAAIGQHSMRDFRLFTHQVAQLTEGSALLNIGSAVIMPEVFLKALTIARNLNYPAHKFATANFDMITHYRPTVNVLNRPTLTGGRKFNFIGHHEIQIPLLHAMVNEAMKTTI